MFPGAAGVPVMGVAYKMGKQVNGFSQRVKKLRARRGISARALAELCGLSKNSIAQYESGGYSPSLTAAVAIADFFDVSLDYLVGRSDRP